MAPCSPQAPCEGNHWRLYFIKLQCKWSDRLSKVKIGIINVTGYAGIELVRILSQHPEISLRAITGRSHSGKTLGEVFPHLTELDLTITNEITESVDLVFSALPHAASAEKLKPFLNSGIKIIDISADFRLKDIDIYKSWYKIEHPCPEFIADSVYGLCELHKKEISESKLVANPGCYSTATILALAPAIDAGIIEPGIIVDAKSGVSGAGRGLKLATHFSEVNENLMAYSIDGHRHMPEIIQELNGISNSMTIRLTFLTHLVPITRGILTSCYAPLTEDFIRSDQDPNTRIREIYQDFYHKEIFTKIADAPPMTKQTLGNNNCIVYPTLDRNNNRLIVISCLDNLVKGAAGQAIQNMNLMCGFEEDEGLKQLALYP